MSQDDVIQTPLQLLTLHLKLLYCDRQVLDLLLVEDTLLGQLDVVPLQVDHGELQLLVDLHPAVIHVSECSGLLGQVLKSRNCTNNESLISCMDYTSEYKLSHLDMFLIMPDQTENKKHFISQTALIFC